MKLPTCDSCNTTIKVEWCESCKRFMWQFVRTKFIVSVYLNLTNSNVQTNHKIELLSPVDRLRIVKERMAGIPTDHADASERYKNMRDLK